MLYRMINFIRVFTFFSFLSVSLHAQQLPIFTQYRELQSIVNPAFISSDYMLNGQRLSVGASYRTQFVGIKRNPKTQILRGEYVSHKGTFFKPVLGGFVLNDQISTFGTTGVYGKIALLGSHDPRYGGFSAGLTAGYSRLSFNATEIAWHDAGDVFAQQNLNKGYVDIGLGVFGYLSLTGKTRFGFGEGSNDIVYGGLSIPQMLSPTLKFSNTPKEIDIQRNPHIYFTAGFYKFIGQDNFIEPSIWVKYVKNAPVHINLNMRYQIKNKLWLGGGYSTAKTLHAETGFWLSNTLKVGYGFDYALSNIASFLGVAHEVHLAFVR